MSTTKWHVGETVRALLADKQMGMDDFARAMHRSRAWGYNAVPRDVWEAFELVAAARVLGVTVEYLEGQPGGKYRQPRSGEHMPPEARRAIESLTASIEIATTTFYRDLNRMFSLTAERIAAHNVNPDDVLGATTIMPPRGRKQHIKRA